MTEPRVPIPEDDPDPLASLGGLFVLGDRVDRLARIMSPAGRRVVFSPR